MITKKGISPLIATVLIIGFVIVLAALVMQWGTSLFEGIKEDTAVSSEVNLICSTGLTNLKINSAVYTTGTLAVTVDNSNEQEVSGFLFRFHDNSDTVATQDTRISSTISASGADATDMSIGAFEVKTYTITQTLTASITDVNDYGKVGVMAIITAEDGSKHTCTNEKKVTVTVPTV